MSGLIDDKQLQQLCDQMGGGGITDEKVRQQFYVDRIPEVVALRL
jgi:hypothetical protein